MAWGNELQRRLIGKLAPMRSQPAVSKDSQHLIHRESVCDAISQQPAARRRKNLQLAVRQFTEAQIGDKVNGLCSSLILLKGPRDLHVR